jgi:hypothetical protein
MIIIKCSKCNKKIFKYIKLGRGQLLHFWKDRIIENMSVNDKKNVRCKCGNFIGINKGDQIKIKKNSIIIKGLKT